MATVNVVVAAHYNPPSVASILVPLHSGQFVERNEARSGGHANNIIAGTVTVDQQTVLRQLSKAANKNWPRSRIRSVGPSSVNMHLCARRRLNSGHFFRHPPAESYIPRVCGRLPYTSSTGGPAAVASAVLTTSKLSAVTAQQGRLNELSVGCVLRRNSRRRGCHHAALTETNAALLRA